MSEKITKLFSAVPNSWDGFFALRDAGVEEARDFLLERSDPPPLPRVVFAPKRPRRKK